MPRPLRKTAFQLLEVQPPLLPRGDRRYYCSSHLARAWHRPRRTSAGKSNKYFKIILAFIIAELSNKPVSIQINIVSRRRGILKNANIASNKYEECKRFKIIQKLLSFRLAVILGRGWFPFSHLRKSHTFTVTKHQQWEIDCSLVRKVGLSELATAKHK